MNEILMIAAEAIRPLLVISTAIAISAIVVIEMIDALISVLQ
ncbi:hypothetical protein [Thermoflexus sp.]|nr:hypothetical protein [Thermoflexus sp.]